MRRAGVVLAACCACGRVGFDALGSRPDGAIADALDSSGTTATIVYVAPFVAHSPGSSSATDTFPAHAHAAGNAVVIQVACAAAAIPTAVSVTAPGWTFMQLGPITASASSKERAATVVAFAPDTTSTTVTVQWTGSTCSSSANEVGDELALSDPMAGTITFDAFAASEGVGNCIGSITTAGASDAVWGACDSSNSVTGVGAGFTKGADDAAGDWSEYKVTTDAAGTGEPVTFSNNNVGYVLSMVTLSPP